jgi:hypothetical protein
VVLSTVCWTVAAVHVIVRIRPCIARRYAVYSTTNSRPLRACAGLLALDLGAPRRGRNWSRSQTLGLSTCSAMSAIRSTSFVSGGGQRCLALPDLPHHCVHIGEVPDLGELAVFEANTLTSETSTLTLVVTISTRLQACGAAVRSQRTLKPVQVAVLFVPGSVIYDKEEATFIAVAEDGHAVGELFVAKTVDYDENTDAFVIRTAQ